MSEQAFPSQLSPSDSLMWHIERDPVLRSPIVVVGLLDREPYWARTRATFQRAAAKIPRFRQLIRGPRFGVGPMRWVDDPSFSLDNHLQRVRAPHPATLRSVLDLAAPAATSVLDPARPLWTCTIVEGLEGGRAAFVLKFHHTLTDGVGGLDLARDVFDHSRRAPTDRSTQAVSGAKARPAFDRLVGAAVSAAGAVAHPVRAARLSAGVARSVARMLAPMPPTLPSLFTTRSLDRRLDTLDLPFDGLQAAADAVGCTINDVFLAAIGGAVRDFHQRFGVELPAIRVTMPISIRTETDAPGGNRFTPARFVLPIEEPDVAERARRAGEIAHRWQREPAVGLTDTLAALLDQLPPPAVSRLFGSMLKNVDVDAVDLAGLREPAYLGGARIDRLWAFAPPTGAAVSVTLLTHGDRACVAVLADTAAVPDPQLLVTCLESAFEQVAALGKRDVQAGSREEAAAKVIDAKEAS